MMRNFSTMCLLLFAFMLATPAWAQDEDDGLNTIRSQLLAADEKNEKLKAENARLKNKLADIRREVNQSQKELEDLKFKYPHRVQSSHEQSPIYSGSMANTPDLAGDDPRIAEAQELYLSGQVMDLSDEQRLRELHLYDLQYRKQELQLDLQDLEIAYSEVGDEHSEELAAIEREIQEIISEERVLKGKIMELENASLAYPQEIDLLKMENKNLKEKIKSLKK